MWRMAARKKHRSRLSALGVNGVETILVQLARLQETQSVTCFVIFSVFIPGIEALILKDVVDACVTAWSLGLYILDERWQQSWRPNPQRKCIYELWVIQKTKNRALFFEVVVRRLFFASFILVSFSEGASRGWLSTAPSHLPSYCLRWYGTHPQQEV